MVPMNDEELRHRLGGPVAAIIVAAGQSRRMGGVDKLFKSVLGKPLLRYSLEVFNASPLVDEIVLVMSEENLGRAEKLVHAAKWEKVHTVRVGGERRRDSVARGLTALPSETKWVLVHDGARPCVTPELIARGLEAVLESGASIPVMPVADTIKVVDKTGQVVRTPERSELWTVQTPQVFSRELLQRAHKANTEDATDDAAMVERLGHPVRVFEGAHSNIKVTTPEDLLLAEVLLSAERTKGTA